MADKPSFYITTPIYYVNAAPHLGTAYCTTLCDVMARYKRSMGYDVKFLTGLDEHGEKVQQAAEEHGMTPQEWCDSLAPAFHEIWHTLEISNDDFIRTTEPRQIAAVTSLWNRMKEAGYIYKGSYDGWYCVPEETYFTETQVAKADEERHTEGQHLCPDCGRPLQRVQEESWFFKLSAFQDRLLALYDEHPDFVMPDFRMNEVRTFVEGGLKDISVSRTSFDWGIPVPFDEKHVTYVWFDALLNYCTAVGFGNPDMADEFARRWPAQFNVVGKDIIRFHCVIWPAMLMAAGLPLPKKVFAHGFLLTKGEKMSKSKGNAVSPADLIGIFGVDAYRYYFMTDVPFGNDGSISMERMVQVYNADLANTWGNLCSRVLNMCGKYFDGQVPAFPDSQADAPNPLRDRAEGLYAEYSAAMDVIDYSGAADAVGKVCTLANHYVEDSAPWNLAKSEETADELAAVIYNALEAIRIMAMFYAPFMPNTSAEVFRRLSLGDIAGIDDVEAAARWGQLPAGNAVVKGDALFPRLKIEEISLEGF